MKKLISTLLISAMLMTTAASFAYAGPADQIGKLPAKQETQAVGPASAIKPVAPLPVGDQTVVNISQTPVLPAQGENLPLPGENVGPTVENQPVQENLPVQTSGRILDPNRPMVALTFDDGPQTAVGNQIMDVAAKYDAKVTFYMTADRVPSRAAEVQRMVAEGHEVGNHTLNHVILTKVSAAEVVKQVEKGNDVIEQYSGVRPATMRLPGGGKNATVIANIHQPIILWNIDTLDWKTKNTASTVSSVLNNVKDGDIVLMHELYSATGNAVDIIIPELAARGFQMVTVSELAAARGGMQPGQVYYSFKK